MNKNKQSTLILLLLMIFLLSSNIAAQGIEPADIERVGQSGWQFLKITGDARIAGMGGAYVAASEANSAAAFGNPAALSGVKNMDISLSHISWIADINIQTLAFAKTFGSLGTFGVSLVYVDYGDMYETINSVVDGEDRTSQVVTGNTFTASDLAIGLTYSRRVTDKLSIGGSIKYIREDLADFNMSNVSFDFGTVYYTGFKSLRVAMTARNFGPDVQLVGWSEEYESEADDIKMPIDFRIGVAMDFFDGPDSPHKLTVSLEGDHPNDAPEKVHLGAEYSFTDAFFLRSGYKFNYDEEGFTVGAGLRYKVYQYMGTFNYSYVDFGNLNKVHMIQLGIAI